MYELVFISRGIDLAYDGIGGELLDDIAENIAIGGKIITTGFVSQYTSGNMKAGTFEPSNGVSPNAAVLPAKLLVKSASLCGFWLSHYDHLYKNTFKILVDLLEGGKIKAKLDFGPGTDFHGLEAISDAVDYLYSKKSIGKIVVKL